MKYIYIFYMCSSLNNYGNVSYHFCICFHLLNKPCFSLSVSNWITNWYEYCGKYFIITVDKLSEPYWCFLDHPTQPQENLWNPSEVNLLTVLNVIWHQYNGVSGSQCVHNMSSTIFSWVPSLHVPLKHWFSIRPPLFHREYWRCRLKTDSVSISSHRALTTCNGIGCSRHITQIH